MGDTTPTPHELGRVRFFVIALVLRAPRSGEMTGPSHGPFLEERRFAHQEESSYSFFRILSMQQCGKYLPSVLFLFYIEIDRSGRHLTCRF